MFCTQTVTLTNKYYWPFKQIQLQKKRVKLKNTSERNISNHVTQLVSTSQPYIIMWISKLLVDCLILSDVVLKFLLDVGQWDYKLQVIVNNFLMLLVVNDSVGTMILTVIEANYLSALRNYKVKLVKHKM